MFWIDIKNKEIKPPTNKPILCHCPEWNSSGYQVAYYENGKFDYEESPNTDFNSCIEQWSVFLEAD